MKGEQRKGPKEEMNWVYVKNGTETYAKLVVRRAVRGSWRGRQESEHAGLCEPRLGIWSVRGGSGRKSRCLFLSSVFKYPEFCSGLPSLYLNIL